MDVVAANTATNQQPIIPVTGFEDYIPPDICSGGAFGYAGFGVEVGKFKAESLLVIAWDSKEGGSHGGIVAVGYGKHVVGGEATRTWRDWKEHHSPIYLPGSSNPANIGPLSVHKDVGGIVQIQNGQVTVGGYGGVSSQKGRAAGGGAYVSLGKCD